MRRGTRRFESSSVITITADAWCSNLNSDSPKTGIARFGKKEIRVEPFVTTGYDGEEHDSLRIMHGEKTMFAGLGDAEATEQVVSKKIASVNETHGYALLHALADFYDMELTER